MAIDRNKHDQQLAKILGCVDKFERIGLLPMLDEGELQQLAQLQRATLDCYLFSAFNRGLLVQKGLATRYDGWNIATRLGLAVLDTLGLLQGSPCNCRK
jgi:hypothetical protein